MTHSGIREIGRDICLVRGDRDCFGPTDYAVVFGLLHTALNLEPDLFTVASSQPDHGSNLLDAAERAIEDGARAARANGAAGIAYVLAGAHAPQSTPMEYGGHILERERELLERLGPGGPELLVVIGSDPYLDFVSDLPAQIFAWDARSGYPVSELRSLRQGLLATDHPDADIIMDAHQFDALILPKERA